MLDFLLIFRLKPQNQAKSYPGAKEQGVNEEAPRSLTLRLGVVKSILISAI